MVALVVLACLLVLAAAQDEEAEIASILHRARTPAESAALRQQLLDVVDGLQLPSSYAEEGRKRQAQMRRHLERKRIALRKALTCDDGSVCKDLQFVQNTKELRDDKTRQYRKALLKRAESLYADNPKALASVKRRMAQMDIDHVVDLQLGGANHWSNMKALDSKINRSVGSQWKAAMDRLQRDNEAEIRKVAGALASCGGTGGRELMSANVCDLEERRALMNRMERLQKAASEPMPHPLLDHAVAPGNTAHSLDEMRVGGRSGLGTRLSSSLDSGAAAVGNHLRESVNVGQRVTNTAEAWSKAASIGARAGVALDAMQGVSQGVAAGLAGYHAGKGLADMWHTGKWNGHEWGQAAKSTVDALTGGVGTTDMVIGATRTTANCINNHGLWGCGHAAAQSVASTVNRGYDASRDCLANRGAAGCLGHAATATGQGLWSFGKGLTSAAYRGVKAVGSGVSHTARDLGRGSLWCAQNLAQCRQSTTSNLRTGFGNIGHALAAPLRSCADGRCLHNAVSSGTSHWRDWRLSGLRNQEQEALRLGHAAQAYQLQARILNNGKWLSQPQHQQQPQRQVFH